MSEENPEVVQTVATVSARPAAVVKNDGSLEKFLEIASLAQEASLAISRHLIGENTSNAKVRIERIRSIASAEIAARRRK